MVRGKKGRAPAKGSVRTRSVALTEAEGKRNSSRRKGTRLEFGNRKLTDTSRLLLNVQTFDSSEKMTSVCCFDNVSFGKTELVEIHKDPKIISSLERQSFTTNQHNGILFKEGELPNAGLFTTDETPVAVPDHGPSTPHRINMPCDRIEELDVPVGPTRRRDNPVSPAFSSVQPVARKPPAGRGRGKLTYNQPNNRQAINSIAAANTNHKLTDYFPVRRSVRKSKKAVLEEKQRDLENKVLCQVEEGLEIRHFVGKGRGVVTTRDFSKGEFVVEYIGELVDQVTAKKREALYAQDQNTGCYMYYFQHRSHQYCVDATAETEKLGRLVNHSRNGNLVARVVEVGSVPHLVLTAKEDIPAGVEVTYDYGDRSREAIRNHPWLAL